MDGGYGAWLGLLPVALMMVLLWGGLIALLWWLFARRRPDTPPTAPVAAEVVDLRYARGEIEEAEWRRLREHLRRLGS